MNNPQENADVSEQLCESVNKFLTRERKLTKTFAERVEKSAAQALRREGHKVQNGMLFRRKPLSEDASIKYEALAEARVVKGLLLSDDPETLRAAAFRSFKLGRIVAAGQLGMELFSDATRGQKSLSVFKKSLATRRKKAESKCERCRQIYKKIFASNPRLSRNALVDRTAKEFADGSNGISGVSPKSVERYTRDLGPSPRPKSR